MIPPVPRFNRPAIEERIAAAAADLGIDDSRIAELAAMAIEDPSAGGSPWT